jgi:hypothetical protein
MEVKLLLIKPRLPAALALFLLPVFSVKEQTVWNPES